MPNPACPHCGTAIEEHEAGRCLDWWVGEAATHVTPRRLWIATSDGGKSATMDSEYRHEVERWVKKHPVVWGKPMSVSHWDIYPRYSVDIAAAWEVVEAMNGRGFWISVYSDSAGTATCWIGEANIIARLPMANGGAPLAICRAAILATQEEKT